MSAIPDNKNETFMENFKSLEKLGLNLKEQKIYLSLLQLETATVTEIGRHAKIKRSTVYDILYRLQTKNYINEITKNKKRFFIANHPENILDLLEDQKRELENDLPLLTSLFNTNPKKPKVAYFEGLDGIKQLYEDTLKSLNKGDKILAYVSADTIKFLEDYSAEYVRRRIEKGIILRGIYQNNLLLKKYLKKNQEQLRISKIVDQKKFPLKNEINIYADKIIIITYSPEPYGILIESKEVANTQRSIFELAWQGIK